MPANTTQMLDYCWLSRAGAIGIASAHADEYEYAGMTAHRG